MGNLTPTSERLMSGARASCRTPPRSKHSTDGAKRLRSSPLANLTSCVSAPPSFRLGITNETRIGRPVGLGIARPRVQAEPERAAGKLPAVRLTSQQPSGVAEAPDHPTLTRSEVARLGIGSKPRRRRAHFGRALVAKVLVGVLLAGIAGTAALGVVAYTTARQVENQVVNEFTIGQNQLQDGKTLLQKATTDRSATELDQAKADFVAAKAHFTRAPDLIAHNPFLNAATQLGVPYVAPRLKAAKSLGVMGSSLADAALIGVDVDMLLIHPKAGASVGPFAILNEMSPKVPQIRQDLVLALQAARAVDPSLLPSSQAASLQKAIDSINKALTSVDQLGTLLPVATEILGGNGARSYLIEQASNPELRAGGGFVGSVSVITADKGQLKLGFSGGVESWIYPRPKAGQPGYVEPPGPLKDFVGSNSWNIADSNYFPDFKTNAHWAEVFAQQEGKIKPDGVISIDPDFIAGLLNVTGPLRVPGYNVTVNSSNFTSWVFQQQFALKNVTSTKKAVFGTIASNLISQLTSIPPSKWPDLMTQLNAMTSQRHLQVYFNNGPAEAIMEQYGWSGSMNPRKSTEYMYEVESNFAATKANHFLSRIYNVDLSIVNGKLHHVITVNLKNSEPMGYEGGNVYDCFVRLYVPSGATSMSDTVLKQKKYVDSTVPAGYQEFQGWVYLPGYAATTLKFTYDTPWSPAGGIQDLYWQKQPGTQSDRISITWRPGGASHSTSGLLDGDKVIELTSSSVTLTSGQAGTATVPSLSL
jgi:hypothetical protein